MSHEIARHWRLRHQRLRLEGFKRQTENGITEVSVTGTSFMEKTGNGYHKEENPFEGKVIFEAEESPIPIQPHREVEVGSSGD